MASYIEKESSHNIYPNSDLYSDLPTTFKSKSSPRRHVYGSNVAPKNLVDLEKQVHQYFDKKFCFKPRDDWQLPPPTEMFVHAKWQLPLLQLMKNGLNAVKNKLNDYNLDDWHRHTRSMNKAGDVIWKLRKDYEPEFLTHAWCKLYENLMSFVLVPPSYIEKTNSFCSVHLCEAPGAFVAALNHYLKIYHSDVRWRWMATTLNPYYEGNPLSCMINDDRFILQTLPHWNFGVDFTGNLMDIKNMSHLIAEADTMGKIHLVTADGSIDCQDDPGEQEVIVAPLQYCEAVAALHILCKGGNLLLKMFTLYECETVCLMYLLCCAFKSVVINKPVTSKEGNSEVYAVCTDYRGYEELRPWLVQLHEHYSSELHLAAMFPKESIPNTFLKQLEKCASQFKSYQVEVILNNIQTFHTKSQDRRFVVRKLRYMVAQHFMEKYKMQLLDEEDEVVGKSKLNEVSTLNIDPRSDEGSYNDRCRRASMLPLELLETLREDLEYLNISWPYGNDSIKWLRFPIRLKGFELETGKPVKKVSSSKFCLGRLLKIRNKVRDVVYNHLKCDLTELFCEKNYTSHTEENESKSETVENVSLLENLTNLYPDALLLNFKKDLWLSMESGYNEEAEKVAFQDIKDAVDDLWRDNTLILFGYPMLTQFNVGMVYMLSHMFEEVGFVKPHKQDFAIIFRSFRRWDVHMRNFFDTVQDRINVANSKGENVLALMPVSILCGTACDFDTSLSNPAASEIASGGPQDFYMCVTETNHLCVKEQVLDIIDTTLQQYGNRELK